MQNSISQLTKMATKMAATCHLALVDTCHPISPNFITSVNLMPEFKYGLGQIKK